MQENNKKRTTVAILCTALHYLGGENKHHLNLYQNINKDKYRVLIVFSSRIEKEVEKYFIDGGVNRENLFYFPSAKKMLFIPLIINLRNLFIREYVDIIHTFFLHSDILGFFSAFFAGKRHVISNVEGQFVLDEVNGVGKIKQACYTFINSIIRPHFFKTVAVTEDLKNELINSYHIPRAKMEVIHIGVDVPSEEAITRDALSHNNGEKIVIGTAARFAKDKGLEYFVQAIPHVAKENPQTRFTLAGIGPEEANLKQLVDDLNIKSIVSFPGWVKDMKKFMREMDVFVMTSIREGCPVTLLDALVFAMYNIHLLIMN